MYPQTVVPSGDNLHTTLTNGMDVAGSGVTATGEHYTANKNGVSWSSGNQELNPVYEYENERYVRVTPWAYETNLTTYRYNYSTEQNPDYIGREGYRWFKVEPIKWIVLNFNKYKDKINEAIGYQTEIDTLYVPQGATLELYAADVLMSGIAFNSGGDTLWTNSDVKTYLNSDFYNRAFSNNDKLQIQESTIYNNNSDGTEFDKAAYGLNSNHLTDGSGMNPTNQKVYLLSRYELSNTESPYFTTNPIFTSNANRQVSGTDYARAHCLYLYEGFPFRYWLRSAYSYTGVHSVLNDGSLGLASAHYATYGTRPALTIFLFCFVGRLFPLVVSILGMYPQTVVPSGDDLHTTLTNGMDVVDSGVTFTGDYYTANKDNKGWNPDDNDPKYSQELNPVYEHDNKRYVRVTPYSRLAYDESSNKQYTYNNGEEIGQVSTDDGTPTYRWFMVEPIKWIVLNYNISILENTDGVMVDSPTILESEIYELYAADVLIGGVPFGTSNHTSWEGSVVNTYLNNVFIDEAFNGNEQLLIQPSIIYNNTGNGVFYSSTDSTFNSNSNYILDGGMNPTEQKIHLLSRYELSNQNSPYVTELEIFGSGSTVVDEPSKRQISGTDYARAHYLIIGGNSFITYWSRTALNNTYMYRVLSDGSLGNGTGGDATLASYGTRPALTCNIRLY